MNVRRDVERPPQGTAGPNESIGEMLTTLASNSAALVRDEILLAKQEVRERALEFRGGVMILVAGAVVLFIGGAILCAAAVLALAIYVDPWLSALIIGGFLALVGGVTAYVGLGRLRRTSLKPEQTIETLEENKEWLKDMT